MSVDNGVKSCWNSETERVKQNDNKHGWLHVLQTQHNSQSKSPTTFPLYQLQYRTYSRNIVITIKMHFSWKQKNIRSHWQVALKMQNTGTELNITWHQFHELHGKEWRWFVLLLVPAVLLPATLTTQNKHQQLPGYTAVVKTTALAFSQHTSIGRGTHIQSHGTHTPSTRVRQEWWWLWTTDRNTLTEAGRTTCKLMDRVHQDNISTVSQNTHSRLQLI